MHVFNSPWQMPCARQWEFNGEQNRSGPYCDGSTLSHILIKQLVCYSLSNCFKLGRGGESMKEL